MIVAVFDNTRHVRVYGLWQWDYGQVLRIQGLNLPTATEIHFSLQETGGESITRIGTTKDGVTDVVIPDSMLENSGIASSYNIYAFVYLTDEISGQTEYKMTLSVKARPKPEAFDAPEEAELFREAIAAVNDAAGRAEVAEKSAEAWIHGNEDYPERAQDNAMYYAGVAQESAKQTTENRLEVQRLASQVFRAEGNVVADKEAVEELKSQAQAAAENALQSEQNAKASEAAAQAAEVGAEVAENQAALYAQQTEADMNTVGQAKAVVMQVGEEVTENKAAVEQMIGDFSITVQKAADDVNAAGRIQVENIQGAGAGAAADVNTTKTEAVQAVQNEGINQVANVQAAAEEIIADREQIQQNTDDIAALQNEARLTSPGIIESAEGETILVADSLDKPFAGMRQYGKSTQETTTGAQLIPYPYQESELTKDGLTFVARPDGSIQVSGTSTKTEGVSIFFFIANNEVTRIKLPAGKYFFGYTPVSPSILCLVAKYAPEGNVVYTAGKSFTLDSESELFGYIAVKAGETVNNTFYPMLNAGTDRTQTLIMKTPNGLPGIPVSSGGNYTDENGQQWIANYRDWGRGVDVQMVGIEIPKETFTLTAGIEVDGGYTRYTVSKAFNNSYKGGAYACMCTHGKWSAYATEADTFSVSVGSFWWTPSDDTGGAETLKAKLLDMIKSDTPLTFVAQLGSPIETPIPADELAAYRALHTNTPTTTIFNDEGVYTEVEYVADTKTYIEQNYVPKASYTSLEERVAALEANAIS